LKGRKVNIEELCNQYGTKEERESIETQCVCDNKCEFWLPDVS